MTLNRRQFAAATVLSVALAAAPGRARIGGRVELRRDEYGVPYLVGDSDAACIYGLGYAQAEDGLAHIEDNFLRALGRASEVHGETTFEDDRLVRALEIPRLAREEYDRSPAHMRAVYDAYAAGLERQIADSGRSLALLDRFAPWLPLALLRYNYHFREYLYYAGLRDDGVVVRFDASEERPNGSNAWAIAPSKSATGNAMLFINPHVAFFGPCRYYECNIQSAQGLRFHGTGRYGFPMPYMGHGPTLGWAYTDNYPDFCDLYAEHFDRPDEPLAYRYGDGYRRAEQWRETIAVASEDGTIARREVDFVKTHHGPIVGRKDGKPLAARLPKIAEGGWFDQWYAMLRARSFAEMRTALVRVDVPYMNMTYADRDGNIYYLYGGAIPVKSEAFDWGEPVDGSDPRTEWRGYHRLEELPQILNPASGYVQNCNSDPRATTPGGDLGGPFPSYMIGSERDNARARRSRQILEATERFTYEAWTDAATDNELYVAGIELPALQAAWRALPGDSARKQLLAPAIALLDGWDRRASVDSAAATLFILWYEKLRALDAPDDARKLALLEEVLAEAEAAWGDWRKPWGEVNRLQALHWSGEGGYDENSPSVPVGGAPGWLGIVFNFYSDEEGAALRLGRRGNSYVSTVEFGEAPRAQTIMVLGQSQEADSPHRFDQAALYARGAFKPAWSSDDAIDRATQLSASFSID